MSQSTIKHYQDVLAKMLEDQFINQFYIDYWGNGAICNGQRFKPNQLKIISSHEFQENNTVTNLFAVITQDGTKGKIVFNSTDPNYESAMQFINKCLDPKNNF